MDNCVGFRILRCKLWQLLKSVGGWLVGGCLATKSNNKSNALLHQYHAKYSDYGCHVEEGGEMDKNGQSIFITTLISLYGLLCNSTLANISPFISNICTCDTWQRELEGRPTCRRKEGTECERIIFQRYVCGRWKVDGIMMMLMMVMSHHNIIQLVCEL